MKCKPGVRLFGLRPEMVVAILAAKTVYDNHNHEFVITSAVDSRHSPTSLHYVGAAIDIRTRHIPAHARQGVSAEIAIALSHEFDVVLERDHIHIEFQPKGT